jgi:hypothetical protein
LIELGFRDLETPISILLLKLSAELRD